MTNRSVATLDTSLLQGTWCAWILDGVNHMDTTFGAAEWNPRHVAIGSVVVLGITRVILKKKQEVHWYSVVHAIFSGYLSLACVWVGVFGAEQLTGSPEPLRSIVCQGPLTSLHRIVPAITMGFGVIDILEGFTYGLDCLMHGCATFTIMAYFSEYDLGEIIVPMLLMEISTVHLGFMKASFLSGTSLTINGVFFLVTFLLIRIIVCPYLWWEIFSISWQYRDDPVSQACLPWHFKYMVFCFGMFFNFLNSFWAYKIVRKVVRKMTGKEKGQGTKRL